MSMVLSAICIIMKAILSSDAWYYTSNNHKQGLIKNRNGQEIWNRFMKLTKMVIYSYGRIYVTMIDHQKIAELFQVVDLKQTNRYKLIKKRDTFLAFYTNNICHE